jgi:predicted nucleotidyltransferase
MRLTAFEIKAIKACFEQTFESNDHIWLFGSRVDDSKKGGDIDLYIETTIAEYTLAFRKKMDFMIYLQNKIGEQKIDVILNCVALQKDKPIYQVAKETGILIQ